MQDRYGNMVLHLLVIADNLVRITSSRKFALQKKAHKLSPLGHVWLHTPASKETCGKRNPQQSRLDPAHPGLQARTI